METHDRDYRPATVLYFGFPGGMLPFPPLLRAGGGGSPPSGKLKYTVWFQARRQPRCADAVIILAVLTTIFDVLLDPPPPAGPGEGSGLSFS